MSDWTLWSEQRPTDTAAAYRWRIPARVILGLEMRPEWTDKLSHVGMGYSDREWWPGCSHWDGCRRTVSAGLEWRPAADGETDILWGGLDLLPCPFTGQKPRVEFSGRWSGAPPYQPEYLSLTSWMVQSNGWRDARKMRDAWNRRADPAPGVSNEDR